MLLVRGSPTKGLLRWHAKTYISPQCSDARKHVLFMSSSQSATKASNDYSASSKLWEDAMSEETEGTGDGGSSNAKRILQHHMSQEENWTGEESVRDAVLRMLVDKYKPLRGPAIRSADDKLKQTPPLVSSSSPAAGPSHIQYAAEQRILPTVEGHKPWLVTFKAPSHAVNVKLGNINPTAPRPSSGRGLGPEGIEEREKKVERSAKRRSEQAQRLGRARESTLDYRLGIRKGEQMHTENRQRRPMPVNIKGWTSLVEERIERARREGQFKTIKGRGKPLARESDEHNPFIAREEFLMNRIVQRNGAAPPWVELQTELEFTIASFRNTLQASWTRRAIRMLSLSRPPSALAALTLLDITSMRDTEWEARERGYHDTAIEEVNSLVRRYNGVAPYPVRKPYHDRKTELDRAYQESAEGIMKGLELRIQSMASGRTSMGGGNFGEGDELDGGRGGNGLSPEVTTGLSGWGIWEVVRAMFKRPEPRTRS